MKKKSKRKFFKILDDLEEEQNFFEHVLRTAGIHEDLVDSANFMVECLEKAWKAQPGGMTSVEKIRLAELLAKSRKLRDNIIMLVASVSGTEPDVFYPHDLIGEA